MEQSTRTNTNPNVRYLPIDRQAECHGTCQHGSEEVRCQFYMAFPYHLIVVDRYIVILLSASIPVFNQSASSANARIHTYLYLYPGFETQQQGIFDH